MLCNRPVWCAGFFLNVSSASRPIFFFIARRDSSSIRIGCTFLSRFVVVCVTSDTWVLLTRTPVARAFSHICRGCCDLTWPSVALRTPPCRPFFFVLTGLPVRVLIEGSLTGFFTPLCRLEASKERRSLFLALRRSALRPLVQFSVLASWAGEVTMMTEGPYMEREALVNGCRSTWSVRAWISDQRTEIRLTDFHPKANSCDFKHLPPPTWSPPLRRFLFTSGGGLSDFAMAVQTQCPSNFVLPDFRNRSLPFPRIGSRTWNANWLAGLELLDSICQCLSRFSSFRRNFPWITGRRIYAGELDPVQSQVILICFSWIGTDRGLYSEMKIGAPCHHWLTRTRFLMNFRSSLLQLEDQANCDFSINVSLLGKFIWF